MSGVIEAGSTRGGRWLQGRRLRIALWAAVTEGILVVTHVIPRWPALIVGAVIAVIAISRIPRLRPGTARDALWILGVWQASVLIVPVLAVILTGLALIALAALAVVALVVLLSDRR